MLNASAARIYLCLDPTDTEAITTTTKKSGHGRGKLPESLRRETEIIDIPESVKQATGGEYDATEDRSRGGPLASLQEFRGYLQCDAYAGYDELSRRSQGTIVEVGCWAHARRKFVEAEKTSPREAHEAVARIKQLYAVEHEANDLDVAARLALCQQKSVPLLAALKGWLDQLAPTALGEAATDARNQWAALNVYVTDGRLAIDNNVAERAVKPFAIGRKNWLFFGNDHSGRRLAILSSFTASCQHCGVNPWTWLKDTLTRLPATPADQLATLLPTPPVQ